MRVLRVPVARLAEGRLRLDAEAEHYVFRVHRAQAGQRLVVFDPELGLQAQATVQADQTVTIETLESAPRAGLPIRLLQAVGKQDKPEQVVRDATVLGAAEVVLVHTARSVAKSEGEARRRRLLRIAVEAARQSGRPDIPSLVGPLPFGQALALATSELQLACAPDEGVPGLRVAFELALRQAGQLPSVDLLIGPEGGLTPGELDQATQAGFQRVGLGPWILRTETAATAALGFFRFYSEP